MLAPASQVYVTRIVVTSREAEEHMSGGYSASSEAMQRTSWRLTEVIKDAQQETKHVAPTEVGKQEFGRVYGDHHEAYSTGIETLGKAIGGLCNALAQFSGNVSGAGADYASGESHSTNTVNQAGGY